MFNCRSLFLLTLFSFFQIAFAQDHFKQMHRAHEEEKFIENKGQWPNSVLFKSKIAAGNIWVQQHKLLFHLQDYSRLFELHQKPQDAEETIFGKQTLVHLNFPSSNEVIKIEKQNRTKTYFNYFIGNDSSKWANNVYGYSEVTMKEFYFGIDLKLITQHEGFKYEFHVQPKTDPSLIYFNYGGVKDVKVAINGNLIIETELGKIIEQKPFTYQSVNGKMKEVQNTFVIKDNQVSFKLGKYDISKELINISFTYFKTLN